VIPETEVRSLLLHELDALRALARRLVADGNRAADLVQDTCAAALATPRPPAPSGRWLATILRNVFRQHRRDSTRRRRREDDYATQRAAEHTDASPAEDLEWHRCLVDTIAALAPELRDVVILHYWRGLSVAEIAAAAGLPRSTVGTRLDRAITMLRERLGARSPHHWRRGLLAFAAVRRPAAAGTWLTASGVLAMKSHVVWLLAGVLALAIGATFFLPSFAPATPNVVPPDARGAPALATDRRDAGELATRREAAAPPTTIADAPTPNATPMLRGIVLSTNGAGIAGLDVVFTAGAKPDPTVPAAVVATSTADGTFTLPQPPANGWLGVQSAQWATVRRESCAVGAVDHEHVVLVAPSRDWAGVVVDARDQPVAGARVVVDVAPSLVPVRAVRGESLALPGDLAAVDTGADGRFTFRGVGWLAGARLVAHCPPLTAATIELPADSRQDLLLRLGATPDAAKVVHGIVVDARGAPLAGATVGAGGTAVRSAADGTFRAPWQWQRPGFVRAVLAGHGAATARLEVGAGRPGWSADNPLVVQLPAEPLVLRGRVLDADGNPVAGAQVWTPDLTYLGIVTTSHDGHELSGEASVEELTSRGGSRLSLATTSDADGAFVLDGVLARDYTVFALEPKTLRAAGPVAVSPAAAVDLWLRREVGRRVAGIVKARDGTSLAGVTVAAARRLPWQRPARDPEPWEGCAMMPLTPAALAKSQKVVTDADGRFTLGELAIDGAYLVCSGDALMLGQAHDLDAAAACDALQLTVDARSKFRVVLGGGQAADAFSLVGSDGQHVTTLVRVETYEMSMGKVAIDDGAGPVTAAAAGEVVVVLWAGEREMSRHTVTLRPGGPHDVRL
jgi:RNA polymerase sigma factor (sigma-70 family)